MRLLDHDSNLSLGADGLHVIVRKLLQSLSTRSDELTNFLNLSEKHTSWYAETGQESWAAVIYDADAKELASLSLSEPERLEWIRTLEKSLEELQHIWTE